MHILITGANGMIGRKLTTRLLQDGQLRGKKITRLTLHDIVAPASLQSGAVDIVARAGDIADGAEVAALFSPPPDVIFHLAAVVSGEAEIDFDKGYRVNLDGTRAILAAARQASNTPRFVFSSSIAVFGGPFPDPIPVEFQLAPQTSYGIQKACCEQLVNDYTRKGFIDGISLRLPTVVVRPGPPNKAASGFFSSIIREPLAGQSAICPVASSIKHWVGSPRATIANLIHASEIDGAALGIRRNITLPGLSVTIDEALATLSAISGPAVAARVRFETDATIERIVANWPQNFDDSQALALGFIGDHDYAAIIQAYIDDELGGVWG